MIENPKVEIVLGSTNLHKIREFKEMLRQIEGLDVLSLTNFPSYTPPKETGDTFEENAIIKARHAAETLQKVVLADDSGLVVPALDGLPGVHSRRYAGQEATDLENRRKLLEAMSHLQEGERRAYYECCLVIAIPKQEEVKSVKGVCEGRILHEERGRNGFGYDSLFVKNEYEKSFAEMDENTKNRISHRHKALEKLIPFLTRYVYRT